MELSVRYQEHSDEGDLLGSIKEQVVTSVVAPSFCTVCKSAYLLRGALCTSEHGQELEQRWSFGKCSRKGPCIQAVGQMMTDDWSSGVSLNWDNIEADQDWRFSGFPADYNHKLSVSSEDNPIDVEGKTAGNTWCFSFQHFISGQEFGNQGLHQVAFDA